MNRRLALLRILIAILCIFSISRCKKNPITPELEDLTRPVIWLNSFELSFTASELGGNPSGQIIKVKNSGQKTLNYTISDDAEWLSETPASGSSSGQILEHTISVNKAGLATQDANYTATITITSSEAYNNPQKVTVSLKINKEPPPEIWVSPSDLNFSATVSGSNSPPQTLKVKNSGKGTLNYGITWDAFWLSVNPNSGSSSGQEISHAVSVNIAGLGEGTQEGTITVTDQNAPNSPQKVKVTLKLSKEPPPEIWISTGTITFKTTLGQNPSPEYLGIKNKGRGTLSYQITWDASWLSITPNSGSSGGQENSHTVSVNIAGLGEGTHAGTITVLDQNASNSPQKVNVTLKLSKEPSPEIWISTGTITFKTTLGQNPSPEYLGIMNKGGGTLSYQITWDASWLSVNPTSGNSTGGENNHTILANAASLGVGSYTGIITITSSNATNSPQQVSVSLEISGLPTDNEIWPSCNPSSGGTGTTVSIPISIKGNVNEISVFGLDLTFDSSLFQYQGIDKGTLTGSWVAVDGNLTGAGTLKVGGFKGSGSTITAGSTGSIAVVTLRVIGTGFSDGYQSQIRISGYTDDIAGMKPEPSTTTFTFKK